LNCVKKLKELLKKNVEIRKLENNDKYITLKNATVSKPDDFEAWLNYGDFLLNELDMPKDAIKAYERAQVLLPNGDFRLRIGEAYAVMGNYDKALSIINESIKDKPRAHAYIILANVYIMMEDYKNAKSACLNALKNDQAFEEAHFILGQLEKKDEVAIEHYRRAIELDPEYHIAWQNLGKRYLKLAKFQLAIESLEKALKFDPNDSWTRLYLANAFWQFGKISEADRHFRILIDQKPNDKEIRRWYFDFLNAKKKRDTEI